ncbi:MAG: hypothetical protein QG603_653 [Patescibacteria group bacterium]|jgi:hypothetical protein|nr:hypothetical protein [Patescibacteria group bacterium]
MKKFLFIIALLAFTFGLGQMVLAASDNGASEKAKVMEKFRSSTLSNTASAYPAVCLQNAIAAREDGIIAASNTRSTALTTALQTRKTALVEAWGMTDQKLRNQARKSTWDNYNKARKAARATYNTTNKNIWKTFHAAAKACGVKSTGVEPENMDQSLSD